WYFTRFGKTREAAQEITKNSKLILDTPPETLHPSAGGRIGTREPLDNMKPSLLPSLLATLILAPCAVAQNQISVPPAPAAASPDGPLQGEEIAILTDAPEVPPQITRSHPTRVKVELEVTEVVKRMADGVDYTFWTFGGSVPGKFIRVRQNDEV